MAIKFNIEPYWDDYNTPTAVDGLTPKEKYNRVLFRPGHAVQARELTQLQSMLQNQVSSVGDHLFKEGSVVIPGSVSVFNDIDYLKLSALNVTANAAIGLTFTDGTNSAKVIHAVEAEGTDPITLFVQYVEGSAKFADAASLTTSGSETATVDTSGKGSIVSIDDGIYYVKKHFVIVKAATVVLSKYTTDVSYDVGLLVNEELVSAGEDLSLNDNAQGTPNESAPGAHRYAIKTSLVKQANNANNGNFVLLARLQNGIVSHQVRATDYSVIEETLARRTYDESGNYTVNPFTASAKDHVGADTTKLSLGIEPSKAYVRGYEIQTLDTTNVDINKARDTALVTDRVTELTHDNYIIVSSLIGTPDTTTFEKFDITNGSVVIGSARARLLNSENTNPVTFKIHVFDVSFTGSYSIDDATTIEDSGNLSATIDSHNLSKDSLVYPLPYERISTCSSETDPLNPPDYNYRFETNRDVGQSQVASDEAIFYCATTNEVFGSVSNEANWVLEVVSFASGTDGTIIDLTASDVVVDNNNVPPKATVTLPAGTYNGDTVKLIAPTIRTLTHKTKSKISASTVLSVALNFNNWQNLGHADVLRIVSIDDNGVDVTRHFDLDNGQRDTHYGVGAIRIKSTSLYVPSADLTVDYEYFSHTTGDFFTVDSYSGAVDYEDIPNYNGIELRSSVDFRPRMDNSGGNYTGTGASTSICPRPLSQFETDIQYYLNRIDKVYLDKDGEFGVLEGVADLNPELPGEPKDAMVLYHVFVPAYTLNPEEVIINYIDNRRYTMRDIGKLESRINNLEYYTTLNMLEAAAEQRQILDNAGLPRFKSGLLVDSFTDTTVGRVNSQEYRASIDRSTGTLRPLFSEGNSKLLFDNPLSDAQKTGDLVTLPYTVSALIDQSQYSGSINVNPFDVFNWTGTLKLTPATDEWKDIDRRPQLIVNQDGVFDALRDILDENVATGTVWNSWQTNWTGATTRTSSNFNWGWAGGVDTTTTRSGTRTRTGVNTSIGTENVTTNVGDRVVEVNFAPFMRSRWVSFEGTRLKPNSTLYAFFDDVDVSDWVNMKDLDNLSAGDQTIHDEAIIVGENTFAANPLGATALTTDANGYIKGSFYVPNNSSLNFRTGDKKFLLTDSSTNNNELTNTSAAAVYTARGLIETQENVVLSTRVPAIQRTTVQQSRVVTSTSTNRRFTWIDPLAQSFMVDIDGGAFITSLELYFTTKDDNIPVQVQIRKMDQGIPTQEIIPFSDITLNSSAVSTTGTTTFTFDSPVYLQDGVEYCFVVLSNSNQYTVKYAEIGEEDDNGNRISKQPYNGVLFKSQNASTWTPDQNKDLAFKLNRAVFDTSTEREVVLYNEASPTRALTYDPLYTTNASADVIVAHKNHGLMDGNSVTLSGITSDVNGIPFAELNTSHTVSSVKRDQYTITVTTPATGTGIGGNSVTATQNLAWDVLLPLVQEITLPNTGMTWGVRGTDALTHTTASTYNPIIINQNHMTLTPQVVLPGSTASLFLKGTLSSSKDNVSPVIDLDRCSGITISNRIDENTDVAETDPVGGSALAKYVTKTVSLDNTSNEIKLFLDVSRPSRTDIEVYYKSGNDLATFDTQNWTLSSKVIPFNDSGSYEEVDYSITPASSFTLFAIKIVFKSQTTSSIPSIRNFRAIAVI